MDEAVKKGMEYEAWLKQKQADDRKKAKEKKKVGKKGKNSNKKEKGKEINVYMKSYSGVIQYNVFDYSNVRLFHILQIERPRMVGEEFFPHLMNFTFAIRA